MTVQVQQKGPGKGQGAGDQAGEDYFEAEVSLMELRKHCLNN